MGAAPSSGELSRAPTSATPASVGAGIENAGEIGATTAVATATGAPAAGLASAEGTPLEFMTNPIIAQPIATPTTPAAPSDHARSERPSFGGGGSTGR